MLTKQALRNTATRLSKMKIEANEAGDEITSMIIEQAVSTVLLAMKTMPDAEKKVEKKEVVKVAKEEVPIINTWDGWLNMGYRIYKGEKSMQRDRQGKALFTEDQAYSF